MGDRPLDPVHHHLAPPGAAEYAHGVEIRERCDAGADRERLARGASVIQPREGGAGGGHAKAGRGARGVATVPVAVERIRIGGRRGVVRVDRVVGVSDQVDPALDLGRIGTEERRIRRLRAACEGGVVRRHRARSAKVRVRVVDTGVDHGDPHVLTVQPGRALPRLRRADEGHAVRVVEVIKANRFDRYHTRKRGKRADLLRGPTHLDAVQGVLELSEHRAAHLLNGRHDGVLPGTQVELDRLPLPGCQLFAGRAAADQGDRIAAHLQNHGPRELAERRRGDGRARCALQRGPAGGLCGGRDRYERSDRQCSQASAHESRGSRRHGHMKGSHQKC